MNEKINMVYQKYQKINLDIKEMSEVIGVSASKTTKMFSDFGEKKIIKEMLLPKWRKIGGTRLWDIEDILEWNINSETKVA